MRNSPYLAVIIFSFFSVVLIGCSWRAGEVQAAQRATEMFYSNMSAEQYDVIYEAASDEFKASAPRQMIMGFMKKVNRSTGACGTATLALATSAIDNHGRYVDMTYTRKCARFGDINEQFSWKIVNQRPVLRAYFVTNPAMLND